MTDGMNIARLQLRNWKNFVEVDVGVPHRLFLIGPNAAGKSNFLDVFRFLKDLASSGGGLRESVRRRGGMRAIRCLAARRDTGVSVMAELESGGVRWRYELGVGEDSDRLPVVHNERVTRGGETLVARPDGEDAADSVRLRQTALEQSAVNREFRELAELFASIRYLHLVPQLIRAPQRSVRADDPYGSDFLERVAAAPACERERRLTAIGDALGVAAPGLDDLELTRDKQGLPRLRARRRRPCGAWQTEDAFSDGTLRLIGLLWAALEQDGPLLLEEPELSLHPDIVQLLPQILYLARQPSEAQLFLSTHAPELLRDQGIGLDETLLFLPGAESTAVVPAASRDDIHNLVVEGGLSLEEAAFPVAALHDRLRLIMPRRYE